MDCRNCSKSLGKDWKLCPHCGTHKDTAEQPSAAKNVPSTVRGQVFEVIVRQALAGAKWAEICAGPMRVNNISKEEVEKEVLRRLRKAAREPRREGETAVLPDVRRRLFEIVDELEEAFSDIPKRSILPDLLHSAADLHDAIARIPRREDLDEVRQLMRQSHCLLSKMSVGPESPELDKELTLLIEGLLAAVIKVPCFRHFTPVSQDELNN